MLFRNICILVFLLMQQVLNSGVVCVVSMLGVRTLSRHVGSERCIMSYRTP
jgi:hypothetical protein